MKIICSQTNIFIGGVDMYGNRKLRVVSRVRFVVFLVVAILGAFMIGACVFGFGASAEGMNRPSYVNVRVLSGDTLWGIAREYCPKDMDIRDYISRIEGHNQIDAGCLTAGEILQVPVYR
jgi:hypothetical protein